MPVKNANPGPLSAVQKIIEDRGMVWPHMTSIQDAIQLSLQFTFEVTERWPPERILANQMQQVTALVRHAVATVPYYRQAFRDLSLPAQGNLTPDDFRALPLLHRQDVQSAGKQLVSGAIPSSHGPSYEVRSSGSTGRPIQVLGTGFTYIFVRALSMRGHLWHGRDLSARAVDIRTPKAPGISSDSGIWTAVPDGGECIRLDMHLPVSELLDRVIDFDPVYLQTHPYTLKGMIKRSVERGVRPQSLREARSLGGAVDWELRKLAREHWDIEVIDNYSAMEVGMIAMQCPETENLHVQSESVLVEVLDDCGRPCFPGEVGRVVVTALHNFATPLIRYEIGDYAEVGDTCSCGRGLPVLKQILGRERNLLVLPSGEKRMPESRIILAEYIPEIRQFQLIQKSLATIEIRLVVPAPLSENRETQICQVLDEKFGHPFEYRFVYVDDIPRAANGKFEEFMSEVT